MIHFFKELFEYSYHFNQQLAAIFTEQPALPSEKPVKLFNHMLSAHQVWNGRVLKEQTSVGGWDIHPLNDLKEIDRANYFNSIQILDQIDLDSIIQYVNSRGEAYSNAVKDILFHVINHSTYHRGQIAMEFRQNGMEPLVTDYIFYKR